MTTPHPIQTIPLIKRLPADLETTISVYLKLANDGGPTFLLESVTGGEQVARYSFVGVDIHRAFVLRNDAWEVRQRQGVEAVHPLGPDETPLQALHQLWRPAPLAPQHPPLPRFMGGLAGFLGYETIRYLEPRLQLTPPAQLPDAIFLQADAIVAFDHAYGQLMLIALARGEDDIPAAQARLAAIEARLAQPLPRQPSPVHLAPPDDARSNMSEEAFCRAVTTAKAHIAAGDIFQVVLSQRLSRRTTAAPFDIYRSLRRINPSPYMFFFDFGNLAGDEPFRLLGASPEMHVRLEGRTASLRPIAGTRPRGHTPAEDEALARELLADPKERAEHVMLVDLGRNDLGRVCEYGSVRVEEQMVVERYSHVMHIVSHVQGSLRPGLGAADLLEATFPAGTVSGAPKVRAMEIINALEPAPRGPYAGAVGYLAVDGSADTCIAIRTMTMQGDVISVQAGAGIVADSEPKKEYQETLHKARAQFAAVEAAEQGE
jgi:anthranilate synthase component 1